MVEEGSQGPLWVEIHIVDSLFFFFIKSTVAIVGNTYIFQFGSQRNDL